MDQNIHRSFKPNKRRRFHRRGRRLPVKRISVQYAHVSICKLLKKNNIRYLEKTHGKGVVRICSRTIPQLQNSAVIIEQLIAENLIEEIGMPTDYAYKMKSLVLFIKPVDPDASGKIEENFGDSSLGYHITVFDVKSQEEKRKDKERQIDHDFQIFRMNKETEEINQVLKSTPAKSNNQNSVSNLMKVDTKSLPKTHFENDDHPKETENPSQNHANIEKEKSEDSKESNIQFGGMMSCENLLKLILTAIVLDILWNSTYTTSL